MTWQRRSYLPMIDTCSTDRSLACDDNIVLVHNGKMIYAIG